jgi:periplasmic divalent cation tolerance protein
MTAPTPFLFLHVTFPDLETARALATTCVETHLAACVNIIPQAHSVYMWEGKTQCEPEVIALFKTTPQHVEALQTAIKQQHPYALPVFIQIPTQSTDSATVDWLKIHLAISER